MIETNQEDQAGSRVGERERRMKRRFQIEQDVRYKMLYGQRIAETGAGKTMNISSSGVWFTTENMLTSGHASGAIDELAGAVERLVPDEADDLRLRGSQQ